MARLGQGTGSGRKMWKAALVACLVGGCRAFLARMNEDLLELEAIRGVLMRLEDTIIFSLIERAQFAHNPNVYNSSFEFAAAEQDRGMSFFGWMLRETEITHAKVRRYDAPDEYPFTPRDQLPPAILPELHYPKFLHPNTINLNGEIQQFYVVQVLGTLTSKQGRPDDDGHYGSSATRDIDVLQAVSRRIHYGKFVAESKFKEQPEVFIPLIQKRDTTGIEKLITKPQVEKTLLMRLERKAMIYGQDFNDKSETCDAHASRKLDAQVMVSLYKDWVIPMTKKVEVEYLLNRLKGVSEDEVHQMLRKKA